MSKVVVLSFKFRMTQFHTLHYMKTDSVKTNDNEDKTKSDGFAGLATVQVGSTGAFCFLVRKIKMTRISYSHRESVDRVMHMFQVGITPVDIAPVDRER